MGVVCETKKRRLESVEPTIAICDVANPITEYRRTAKINEATPYPQIVTTRITELSGLNLNVVPRSFGM